MKGTIVTNVKYADGKIIGADVTLVGGADWRDAVDKYNGNGDATYMKKFDASIQAFKGGLTVEAAAEAVKAEVDKAQC